MCHIHIMVDTPIRHPTAKTDAVTILPFRKATNMWVAEPDFSYMMSTTGFLSYVNTYTPTTSTPVTVGGFVPSSETISESAGDLVDTVTPNAIDMASDKITSIRYAIKSPSLAREWTLAAKVNGGTFLAMIPKWPGGGYNVTRTTAYDVSGDATVYPNMMAWFKTGYVFFSGSVEVSTHSVVGHVRTSGPYNHIAGDGSTASNSTYTRYIVGGRPSFLQQHAVIANTVRGVYNHVRPMERIPENNSNTTERVFYNEAWFGNSFNIVQYMCAGDDFEFAWFAGPPTVYYVDRP